MSLKCRGKRCSGRFSRLGGMRRYRALALTLALSLAASVALGACGGEDSPELLPGQTASEINANLSLVEDLVAGGDCVGATNAAAAVSEQVEALTGVNQKLKETLANGTGRLQEVLAECEEAPEENEDETFPAEEPDELEQQQREKEEQREEKEAEREAEKEQQQEEKPEKEAPPAQKEPKEEPEVPSKEEPTPPSGGVSPSAPAGEVE